MSPFMEYIRALALTASMYARSNTTRSESQLLVCIIWKIKSCLSFNASFDEEENDVCKKLLSILDDNLILKLPVTRSVIDIIALFNTMMDLIIDGYVDVCNEYSIHPLLCFLQERITSSLPEYNSNKLIDSLYKIPIRNTSNINDEQQIRDHITNSVKACNDELRKMVGVDVFNSKINHRVTNDVFGINEFSVESVHNELIETIIKEFVRKIE
jgi:hypothetical protein